MYAKISDDKLIDMLSRLGLGKFASSDALEMMVSEGGSNLSGGERKRICIARALLRNTDVLILDEPLANLDSITASSIEEEILNIRDRTILVVSHQFSEKNIGMFDRVIEMQSSNSYGTSTLFRTDF
jgi:ABC-type transport system involved in cytochrome bd biosynthesis fused ATPase/permease subunit